MRTLYFCPVVSSFYGRLDFDILPCGLRAILRCRSETCCTRLAENTGRKSRQKSPSGHHRTTVSGYVFTTKARIDNRKKTYLPHMPSQYGELGRLAAEIGSGAPLRISPGLVSWLHRRPTKLCTIFGGFLGWCTLSSFQRCQSKVNIPQAVRPVMTFQDL